MTFHSRFIDPCGEIVLRQPFSPQIQEFASEMQKVVDSRDYLQSQVDSLAATIAINFGPEGRIKDRITVDTDRRLDHQVIDIIRFYELKVCELELQLKRKGAVT